MTKSSNNITEDELLSAFGLAPTKAKTDNVEVDVSTPLASSGLTIDTNELVGAFLGGTDDVASRVSRSQKAERNRARQAQLNQKRIRSQEWQRELAMQKQKEQALREEQEREIARQNAQNMFSNNNNAGDSRKEFTDVRDVREARDARDANLTRTINNESAAQTSKTPSLAGANTPNNSQQFAQQEASHGEATKPKRQKVTPESFRRHPANNPNYDARRDRRSASSYNYYGTSEKPASVTSGNPRTSESRQITDTSRFGESSRIAGVSSRLETNTNPNPKFDAEGKEFISENIVEQTGLTDQKTNDFNSAKNDIERRGVVDEELREPLSKPMYDNESLQESEFAKDSNIALEHDNAVKDESGGEMYEAVQEAAHEVVRERQHDSNNDKKAFSFPSSRGKKASHAASSNTSSESPAGTVIIICAVLLVLIAVSILTGLWDISNL